MKSPAAYYLLLLYVSVMFKPLLPMVSDFWVHEFSEIEHISTVHALYGSNHVQKEVAENEKEQQRSSQNNQGNETAVHLPAATWVIFKPFIASKQYNELPVFNYQLPLINLPAEPPQNV